MNSLKLVSAVLVVVGAINWGLVGLADFDLVLALLGSSELLVKAVYLLVGLAGVYVAYDMWGAPKKGKK